MFYDNIIIIEAIGHLNTLKCMLTVIEQRHDNPTWLVLAVFYHQSILNSSVLYKHVMHPQFEKWRGGGRALQLSIRTSFRPFALSGSNYVMPCKTYFAKWSPKTGSVSLARVLVSPSCFTDLLPYCFNLWISCPGCGLSCLVIFFNFEDSAQMITIKWQCV